MKSPGVFPWHLACTLWIETYICISVKLLLRQCQCPLLKSNSIECSWIAFWDLSPDNVCEIATSHKADEFKIRSRHALLTCCRHDLITTLPYVNERWFSVVGLWLLYNMGLWKQVNFFLCYLVYYIRTYTPQRVIQKCVSCCTSSRIVCQQVTHQCEKTVTCSLDKQVWLHSVYVNSWFHSC